MKLFPQLLDSDAAPVLPSPSLVRSLKEKFLTDPASTDLSILRPVIARSWQRSLAFNVNPARSPMELFAVPQIDSHLLRAAEPVLARLENLCTDAGGCVSLADAAGTIAVFRGDPAVVRLADRIFPTHGGQMSEDIVGTNSDGTAIEEGRSIQVRGAEHFNEALQDTFCTSALVRDPLQRSVRAVLCITLPERVAKDIDVRSILNIAEAAAAEISAALITRLAAKELALLYEYMREMRKRGSDAVVAMDDRTTIVSREATQLLSEADYGVLSAYAREASTLARPVARNMLCAEGLMQLQARPVFSDDQPIGAVLRLRSLSRGALPRTGALPPREDEFKDFVGESPAAMKVLETARAAIARRSSVYLIGGAGTGKRHLSNLIGRAIAPDMMTVDCGTSGEPPEFGAILERVQAGGATTLLSVDRLDGDLRDRLAGAIRAAERPCVILTMGQFNETLKDLISALRGIEIALPPLRMRREDIQLLVNHFLRQIGHQRPASPRLVEFLAAAEWPGNVAQLKETVEAIASGVTAREVRLQDIPQAYRQALARSRLSRLEEAELQQIREVLVETGGNRVKAAALLRIGRSTLYRKIEMYVARGFQVEEPLFSGSGQD